MDLTIVRSLRDAAPSRRLFLKGAGIAGAGLTLANMGVLRVSAQSSEKVSDIINIAATAEALAVSLLGAAVDGAASYTNADGSKGLAGPLVTILKAAQSAELAHYNFLTGAGAKPLTLTFNIPNPKIASDTTTLFQTIEQLESAFIAAYMTAQLEFASQKLDDLVKVAQEIGGVECEHRALARVALGAALPHNLAFERSMFATVADAAAALQKLGFIGGSGTAIMFDTYSGKVDNTGEHNLTPIGPSAMVTNNPVAPEADVFGQMLWAKEHGGDPSGYGSIDRSDQVTWNSVAIHGH